MTGDQAVSLALALIASGVMIPLIVATFRGWVPRWQTQPAAPYWTGTALLLAYVASLIGGIPPILGASDNTTVRCINIGAAVAVVGIAAHVIGAFRVRKALRSDTRHDMGSA
ncbi:hypothetical protein [Yinghuangia sp. YIM S10712]|uniref:hypothetical protein n=1 Tax=Yinghuangia sp. YIM S10712 TaxID=3436930 RepID=UPI003F530AC5